MGGDPLARWARLDGAGHPRGSGRCIEVRNNMARGRAGWRREKRAADA